MGRYSNILRVTNFKIKLIHFPLPLFHLTTLCNLPFFHPGIFTKKARISCIIWFLLWHNEGSSHTGRIVILLPFIFYILGTEYVISLFSCSNISISFIYIKCFCFFSTSSFHLSQSFRLNLLIFVRT